MSSNRRRATECILQRPSEDFDKLYEKHNKLGTGTYGETFRCTERATGKEYACKSIAKWKVKSLADAKDIRREVRIMHMLVGHDTIVEIKGAYEDSTDVHLVMELCRGGELFERIQLRKMYTEKAAADCIRQIVTSVQDCHFHNVIHRDLKPENFLFLNENDDSHLKVTDFGLSAFFKSGEVFHSPVGSLYYVAPEVLNHNYGPECDVWSAGVILYILLSGTPPFNHPDKKQIELAIKHARIDLESRHWQNISKEAKHLIRGMLTRNPALRFTTQQVLDHPWIAQDDVAPRRPLDLTVLQRMRAFAAMNKFKKVAFNVIASHLSNEEIVGLKKVFESMDRNHTGNISLEDLREGLASKGCYLSEMEAGQLLVAADLDQDGLINYNEFLAATLHVSKLQQQDRIHAAFQYFDRDGSGFISSQEIAQALSDHHISINRATLFQIIADADLDHDGLIDYDEFTAMMMRSENDSFGPLGAPNASSTIPTDLSSSGTHVPIQSPRP